MPQLVILAMLLAGQSHAQTPNDRWMTVETEHFRFHYPESAEDWALQGADHMESIRDRVIAEVGWAPPKKMDIVIRDPMSTANGSALPLQGAPRMEFWSTPPDSASVIGHYRTWGELLLTHEFAHQAHLLRTARNPGEQILESLTGIGPVARKCPRWVSEGYATVVEARLSGFGRPNASYRAAFLRRLAQEGKMPTYNQLNDFSRFSGGAFAYLVGSAYLEWLDARAGGDSLVKLWRRLTAVEQRSFEDGFSGIYGDSPDRLYARFVAELTHAALEIEQQRPVDEGTLWQEITWYTDEPAVSPDGDKVAVVIRNRKGPSKLQIWSTTEADEEELEEQQEDRDERMEKDPDDVLAIDPPHPPRKEIADRVHATRGASQPRFMPDNNSLLFTSKRYDASGRLRPDLYLWDHEEETERRVTVLADVRTADPSPDGTFAIAVGLNWGRTHLVRVDIETGETSTVTEPDVDVVYDRPRISPDGNRVAYLIQRGAGWEVEVLDFGSGETVALGGGAGAGIPTHIAWGPDSQSLYASVGVGGFIEIHEILAGGGRGRQITRSRGAAVAPAPTPDGESVFYLSLDYTGLELHKIELADVEADIAEISAPVPAVVPAVAPPVPPLESRGHGEPHRYGLGRSEIRPLIGGAYSNSQEHLEMGVRVGDIVGKRDALLMVAYGGETGVTGALAAAEYRGLPVEIGVQGFTAIEEPEVMRRYGGALNLGGDRSGSALGAHYRLGAWVDQPYAERVSDADSDVVPNDAVVFITPSRQAGYAQVGASLVEPRRAGMGLGITLRGQYGATGGEAWKRGESTTSIWVGKGARLRGTYTRGFSDAVSGLDRYRLGGVPSAVLPEVWQWSRMQSPGFALGSLRGANRDKVRAEIAGLGPGTLFGERHRMEDGPLVGPGATLVGIGGTFSIEEQPYGKLPSLTAKSGLGCQIENALDGWDEKPCQALDDYRFWASATWRL